MDHTDDLLRDIAATLETVVGRIAQIPDDADLKGETWEAIERIVAGAKYLRRYR
jgi:hypothetical protein